MDICAFTHEHPGTRRCTIHPCTLAPTLTNNTTNHCISVHIWDQSRKCLYPLSRVCGCALLNIFVGRQGNGSWQLLVVAGLGDSGERRPTRLQRCPGRSTCRWKIVIRTLELLGEIREFLEDFSENGVKSLHIVSYLQSLRRRDAGEVGAWICKAHFEHVTCFSDEKIFRIDAVAPGRSFHTFYRGQQGQRDNATLPFRCTPCEKKGWVALLRRTTFEPLFTTHPSEVGSTTLWTVLAAMLRGPLSHPICGQTTAFCGVWSAIQGASALQCCPLSAHSNRCVIAFHGWLSRQTALDHPIHAQNFTIRSHSTAQVPCSCLASTCSDVSSRPPCFEIFVMEGHVSANSQF